jgi:hypothetical protein
MVVIIVVVAAVRAVEFLLAAHAFPRGAGRGASARELCSHAPGTGNENRVALRARACDPSD